jgi:hypothetical protein
MPDKRSTQTHKIVRALHFHFSEAGRVVASADGSVNVQVSPVATLFVPRVVRGGLWTVGEVHRS